MVLGGTPAPERSAAVGRRLRQRRRRPALRPSVLVSNRQPVASRWNLQSLAPVLATVPLAPASLPGPASTAETLEVPREVEE
jgi:hypothetical protein